MKKRKWSAQVVVTCSRPELKLDWCSYAAAKYAVEHWHYSHKLPPGRIVRVGVWENRVFVGCVCFSRGANNHLMMPYNLTQHEGCELIRMALSPTHCYEVSRITAIAIRLLRTLSPLLRLLVSFADPAQGHHGGIYQAMGWIYSGRTGGDTEYFIDGQWRKQRVFRSSDWSKYSGISYAHLPKRKTEPKHRYLYPLDAAIRTQIEPLRQAYPKRVASILADVPGVQPGEGRAALTAALTHQIE